MPKRRPASKYYDAGRVIWEPNPGAQRRLLSCPCNEILYGGAKGGGKSDGILGDWLAHVARNPKWARGIVFRKDYPSLEQLIERSLEMFAAVGAIWKAGKKTWYFPGGARLKFRFADKVADVKKYQGHEYTWIAFDEVGDIGDEEIVNTLRGALRSSKAITDRRLLLCGNPLGVGHKWLKRRFIDGIPAETPIIEKMVLPNGKTTTWTRVFIPATIEDNPKLLEQDPGYLLRLSQMCKGRPGLYRALRWGDWSAKLEIPGALLTSSEIDDNRVSRHDNPACEYIVVALDPSGSGKPDADKCGIVVSGCIGRHKYVLEDASIQGSPKVWARRAIKMWYKWEANAFVAEVNFGAEMVAEVISKYDDTIKVEPINCSKGKHVRAEPAAAEYSRGYVHHVGQFDELEEQWTTWIPNSGMRSPNSLDAAVFSLHRLSNGQDGLSIRDL